MQYVLLGRRPSQCIGYGRLMSFAMRTKLDIVRYTISMNLAVLYSHMNTEECKPEI